MRRTARTLSMAILGLAFATMTVPAAAAAPAPPATIASQRKALYQSELEQSILLRTQLGYGFIAANGPLHTAPA